MWGVSMKAVLEFNYPEDEEKLRCALHGEAAMAALRKIHGMVKLQYTDVDFRSMCNTLFEIQRIASTTLFESGENK